MIIIEIEAQMSQEDAVHYFCKSIGYDSRPVTLLAFGHTLEIIPYMVHDFKEQLLVMPDVDFHIMLSMFDNGFSIDDIWNYILVTTEGLVYYEEDLPF